MKNAKTHKIFLTLAVAMLMLVVALFPLVSGSTKVEAAVADANDYFSGLADENISFKDGMVQALVGEDSISAGSVVDEETNSTDRNVLSIDNLLVINDFGMELNVPEGLESLTVVFKNEAYYENGNPMAKRDDNGAFTNEFTAKKEIVNELKFVFGVNKIELTFNGDSSTKQEIVRASDSIVINTGVNADSYLVATVSAGAGDCQITAGDVVFGSGIKEYRKIKSIDGKALAQIKFMFKLTSAFNVETPYIFGIKYIDQKVSDVSGKYKQTFETKADGSLEKTDVYPRVAIDQSFYKKNADGSYEIKKDLMQKYTLTFKTFSVIDVSTSEIYIKESDANVWTDPSTITPKALRFNEVGTYSFEIAGKGNTVYERVENITIVNFDEDDIAPEYEYDAVAIQSFKLALKDAYYDGHHTALGETITLPSFKDLVFDNCYGYESLQETTHYMSDNTDYQSLGGLSFQISTAGKYEFFVRFADGMDNEMKEASFLKDTDFTDPNAPADYTDYIFGFEISDDAPIKVEPPVPQGLGYVGVEYRASAFDVNADGCKVVYTLYYNANADANDADDGWIEIPNASTTTDKAFDDGNYNYEEVQAIGFKNSTTFTPDKAGAYKLVCTATSNVTSRFDSEYSIIVVTDEIVTVTPVDTTWVQENVWTIVFLGVGTLCLVAIVVLLFIKPKDKTQSK